MTRAIDRTLETDRSVATVWRALTDPSELASWFGDSAELAAEAGADGWFGWESHGRFAVRVLALEPERSLTWRWAREPEVPLEDGLSTVVEWILEPRPGVGTTIRLHEGGFDSEADREQNVRGWRQELAHLADHLRQR